MSQEEPESSYAPLRRKRASRVALSDDDDEDHRQEPSPGKSVNGAKRRKSGARGGGHEESDEDGNEGDESMMMPNLKRNGHRNGVASEEEEEGGDEGEEDQQALASADAEGSFKPKYERGADGFVAGSVVRIKLVNFMTYNYVEFRPGPHLNMILGPNGTGKSTIAAGIAIGLGFHPKLMGRATDLKSYVKQGGGDEAEVEVELKGRPGKRNPIIWRKFSREDEKSEFKLNGEPTTKRAVLELVESFGVQATNLCCFLPQDKVSEFAKMTPDLVLKETMRAAGDERLTGWYNTLCEKDAKRRSVEQTFEADAAELKKIADQAEGLEGDVRLYQDKREKEEKREVLMVEKHFARLQELQKRKRATKAQRNKLDQEIRDLNERDQPLQALDRKYRKLADRAKTSLGDANEKRVESEREWRKGLERVQSVIEGQENLDKELKSLRRVAERRAADQKLLEDKLAKAQRILDEPLEEVQQQVDAVTAQMKKTSQKIRAARDEHTNVVDEIRAGDREIQEMRTALDVKLKQLERLQNVSAQRELQAGDFDPCIAWLIKWLERHNDLLKGAWHKPPMISVDVPDKRYAAQVEACTSVAIRKTFIFEAKEDYDLIVEKLQGRVPPEHAEHQYTTSNRPSFTIRKLMFHATYLEVTERNVNPPRLCSPEKLNSMGLDGWAIDFVDAKPAVIAFLNERGGLATAAVTLRDGGGINDDEMARIGISRWATRSDITNAQRSAYGARSVFSSTRQIEPSKAFGLVSDQAGIAKITEDLGTIKRRLHDIEGPSTTRTKLEKEKREEVEKLQMVAAKLKGEMTSLSDKRAKHSRAVVEIQDCKSKIAAIIRQPSTEERRSKLRAEKLKQLREAMPLVRAFEASPTLVILVDHYLQHQTTLDKISTFSRDVCDLTLRRCQIETDKQAIQARVEETSGEQQRLLTEREEVVQKMHEQNIQFEDVKKAGMVAVSDSTLPDINQRILIRFGAGLESYPSVHDIQQELDAVMAELSLAHGVDESTVIRHRRLELQRKELEGRVVAHRKNLDGMRKQIRDIETKFLPGIDALIAAVSKKFSAAFQRVQCTGDIQLDKSEMGYDRWGIRILVSYRDTDALSVLTGTTQSGGERSLATVTYLMSLSEMARTPFSLVDEINQGMDKRAERAVHNQLVDTTCGADTGQYFLITPKLLTDLHYHPRMKVLVVNSGPGLPDTRKKRNQWGDLGACLKRYKASHGVAAH